MVYYTRERGSLGRWKEPDSPSRIFYKVEVSVTSTDYNLQASLRFCTLPDKATDRFVKEMKSEGLFQLSKAFFRCGDASLFKRLWFAAITEENEQHFLSFTAVLLQMQHIAYSQRLSSG